MTVQDTKWPDSLWRSTAEPVPDFDELNQDIETDLLIVGAGYTGLSTALHAVDHVKDIVIIDQAQPGWGCSGRNGGQIHVQWKPDLATLKQLYPGSQFETFIETMGAAVQLVFDLVEKHQIDCQAQRTGSVIAGKGTKAIRYLTEWSRFWAEAGEDVRLLDKSDTSELIGPLIMIGACWITAAAVCSRWPTVVVWPRPAKSGVSLFMATPAQSEFARTGKAGKFQLLVGASNADVWYLLPMVTRITFGRDCLERLSRLPAC